MGHIIGYTTPVQNQKLNERFSIHGLTERMRHMKIKADFGKHGFYLMVSIFREEAFKNKIEMGFKFLN